MIFDFRLQALIRASMELKLPVACLLVASSGSCVLDSSSGSNCVLVIGKSIRGFSIVFSAFIWHGSSDSKAKVS